MTNKINIEQKFEELIANLAISDAVEKIYRHGILHLFYLIKDRFVGGRYVSHSWFDGIEPIALSTPFYGGSFDRHTNIRGISDIDVYFVYLLTNYRQHLSYTAFPEELMNPNLLNLGDSSSKNSGNAFFQFNFLSE